MNDFRLYGNVETVYDAWELSRDYLSDRLDAVVPLSVTVSGDGTPVFTAAVRRQIGQSLCEQTIRLRAASDRIDFETDVDWQESRKLLKVHFESGLLCDQAVHGMQFCHIARPAHRSGPLAADQYEVCNFRYSALFEAGRGIILQNRSIRGISCDDGDLALSLLRAPLIPDRTCDRGPHHFSFALSVCDVPFVFSGATERAYAYETPLLILPEKGRTRDGFRAEGAVIETVKPAENGEGIILRLWENRGTRTRVKLCLPEPAWVFSCEMDESASESLAASPLAACELTLPPFGIRTLRISRVQEQGSEPGSSQECIPS